MSFVHPAGRLFSVLCFIKDFVLRQETGFFCSALPLLLPMVLISSLGPHSRRLDYGWRPEYL